MARAAKRFVDTTALAATDTTIIAAVPATQLNILRHIRLANVTASAATYNLALNATSATAGNCFAFQVSIPASSIVDSYVYIIMNPTDTLHALCGTASAITVTVNGEAITLG